MNNTTLKRTGATESLIDVRDLIYDTIHKFRDSHPVDFQDALSEGYMGFVEALLSFKPGKASFVTWMRFIIHHKLLSMSRNYCQRLAREHCEPPESLKLRSQRQRFQLQTLMNEVSKDAREVIALCLRPPVQISLELRCKPSHLRHHDYLRDLVAEYLMDYEEWPGKRVIKAFDEIRDALVQKS